MNRQSIIVFSLTFLAYAGLHSLRQGWSYTKPQLKKEFGIEQIYFGLTDTLYLVSYSIGMMTLGNFTDKVSLKLFVAYGMILSALFYSFFAIYYQIFQVFSIPLMIVMMSFNGFFQCTGWPGLMGIMGNWFAKGKTGIILGVWAINANIGNIIAQLMCNILQQELNASWTFNFICTGIFTILIAILIIFLLKDKPSSLAKDKALSQQQKNIQSRDPLNNETNLNLQDSILNSQNNQNQESQKQQKTQQIVSAKKINVFRAFLLPRVPFYVIGYAMLKGCIYGLLFWLPTYLTDKNLGQQKGYISAMVDIGSFIGGLTIGYFSDKTGYRALFLSPLLFLSSIIMFVVAFLLTDQAWQFYIAMFWIGITIGGPYNIIGSVITIDLGQQSKKLGGNVATISALVEGSAAIFAAGSQTIISLLHQSQIFYVFFLQCLIAAIVLFPLFLKQWRQLKAKKNDKSKLNPLLYQPQDQSQAFE